MTTGKPSIISPGNLWLHAHKRILSLNLIRCKSRSNAKRLHPNLLRLIGIALPWVSLDTYVSDSIHDPDDWLTDWPEKEDTPARTQPRDWLILLLYWFHAVKRNTSGVNRLSESCDLIMQLHAYMNDGSCMFHDDFFPCYPLWYLLCLCYNIWLHISPGLFKAAFLGIYIMFHTLGSDIVLFMVSDDLLWHIIIPAYLYW